MRRAFFVENESGASGPFSHSNIPFDRANGPNRGASDPTSSASDPKYGSNARIHTNINNSSPFELLKSLEESAEREQLRS